MTNQVYVAFLVFTFGAAHCGAEKISAVQSVITLLEKLEKQTMEEGKAEAAAYDKFVCWCKEQADEKLYSVTKAGDEEFNKYAVQRDDLAGAITGVEGAIEMLKA